MIVKLIEIIPVFKYFHEGTEIWINNQFVEAKTFTKKNSREFKFTAKRKGSKIEIKSRGKKITAITEAGLKKFKKKGVVDRNIESKKAFKIMNKGKN